MIDLHTHTTYSDGTDSVVELLKKAEEIGLEYLSITDHSSCGAYKEIDNMNISQYYTGKIIRGCELFTTINGATIELLGYNVDTDILNQELPKVYKYSFEDINKFEIFKSIEICKKFGVKLNEDDMDFNSNIFSSRVLHKEITRYDENKKFINSEKIWQSTYAFYRECMSNPDSVFFVDKSELFPSVSETIKLIRKANGLVFIPHICVYGENSIKFLEELTKNHVIDGIECYYSLYTKEETEFLLDFCKKNKYYISGGTDYHGLTKKDISLGIGRENMNIPKEIIMNWMNNRYVKV